jgi:SAM-dependent methyltransferase
MDQMKVNEFVGKFMNDATSALNILLVFLGNKLGLYRAMVESGRSITSDELAARTGTNPRMVKEWLASQAANGYVLYDPNSQSFSFPPEHAFVLANENSPVYLQGGVETAYSLYKDEEKIERAMKTGKGLGWGDHCPEFYEAQEKLTRPIYGNNLVQSWIPALDGVEEKLRRGGAKVAEIGSGHGYALVQMARNYPLSTFVGYDSDKASIASARKMAENEGALNNLRFGVANSTGYPVEDYDLIAFLGCLHDMRDPQGALTHSYESLRKRNGTLMVSESPAGDKLEDNFTPIGRLLYSVSTVECVPASLNEDGVAFGTLMGESKLRELVASSGFTRFRRIIETPLANVYEAKADAQV